jgi:hypothetical protein
VDGIRNAFINGVGTVFINNETPFITRDYTVGADPIDQLNSYDPIVVRADETIKETELVSFYAIRDTLTIADTVIFDAFDGYDTTTTPFTVIMRTDTFFDVPVPISLATLQYFMGSGVNNYETFQAQEADAELAAKYQETLIKYRNKAFRYSGNQLNFNISYGLGGSILVSIIRTKRSKRIHRA